MFLNSMPQFPYLQIGNDNGAYPRGFLWGFHGDGKGKYLEQDLVPGKFYLGRAHTLESNLLVHSPAPSLTICSTLELAYAFWA